MKKIPRGRLLSRTITLALITALLAAPGCSIPDLERHDPVAGTIAGTGVSAPVSIVRDANGVAHVRAESEEDLFFAAGYAMAQDRFMMMDVLRRAGSGRLAELLGSPVSYRGYDIPHIDIALRAFRFEEAAERGAAELDPASRRQLEAFTRGVNKYLEDGGDSIAIYHAWKSAPEPWRVRDCFLVAAIMGFTMTGTSLAEEYYLERIRREQGDTVRDLFVPSHPDDTVIITRDQPLLSLAPSGPLARPLDGPGSNNWALAGSRTVSGLPLLANDPHVPHTIIPTFWWHCHLEGAGYDVMGMMFPGFPAFGAAQNGKIGWALTNVMADYIDLWRERVDPDDPEEYEYEGQWEKFMSEPGEVRVRGRKPVKYALRSSRHGVVIDQRLLGWKVASEPGEVLAVKYADLDFARWYRGYQTMARAGSFEEWRAGAEDEAWGPFAWNHVYADVNGKIAYWATGHFPVRNDQQGWIARRGWEADQDWQGYAPFADNPHLVDPGKGYLVSANNRSELPGHPYYITVDYTGPSRAGRISELIEEKPKHSAEDMERIQYDVAAWGPRRLVPIILEDLADADGRDLALAADLLREWRDAGYVADADSPGAAVYEVFYNYFPAAVFEDEFNGHTARGAGLAGLFAAGLDKIISDPESVWFDDKKTVRVETRGDITRRTMKDTVKYLKKELGRDPADWKWGGINQLSLSPALAPVPGKIKDASRGPFPLPGTHETVRAAGALFLGPLGFQGFIGPSTHWIVDLSDPRRARFNATAGMSDNQDGGRYDNLTDDWLEGRYRTMSMEAEEYEKDMMGEVVLEP